MGHGRFIGLMFGFLVWGFLADFIHYYMVMASWYGVTFMPISSMLASSEHDILTMYYESEEIEDMQGINM